MSGVRVYILVTAAILLGGLAAMLPFAWSGADVLASSYKETAARELESNARLFSLAISSRIDANAPEKLLSLAGEARKESGVRFTVIHRDGTVAADSDEDAGRMENHLNRPEIKASIAGETGVGTRSSPTLGTDWMYVAVPLADGNVARAAASMADLNNRLTQWWTRALVRFIGSLVILLLMALFLSRLISRPIEIAAEGAERYAQGDLSYRLPVSGAAEMRRLSESMSAMAAELDARFKLVNRQREEMRVVFENMSEGVLAIDATGLVMLVNGAAQSILNLPRDASGTSIEAVSRNAELLDVIR